MTNDLKQLMEYLQELHTDAEEQYRSDDDKYGQWYARGKATAYRKSLDMLEKLMESQTND